MLVTLPNIKLNKNLFSGYQVVTYGQIGRGYEASGQIFAIFSCEHA
jgi:hypothetical protein